MQCFVINLFLSSKLDYAIVCFLSDMSESVIAAVMPSRAPFANNSANTADRDKNKNEDG